MCQRTVSTERYSSVAIRSESGGSVGLGEMSRESGTVERLLAAADSACYVAKKQGSGRVAVYSARDEALARHTGEIQWLQKLQGALKEDRFQLYYQPIVRVASGEVARHSTRPGNPGANRQLPSVAGKRHPRQNALHSST